MALSNRSAVWRGPPLLLQILLLLLGGLVVAQAVTLALTLILPPAPAQQHQLDAVAAALRGQPIEEDRPDRLVRKLQNDPPDISGPSWLVSEHSQRELASLLNADAATVRLAFYTPLPFAGTVAPRRPAGDVVGQAESAPAARPVRVTRGVERSSYLQLASYDPGQGGGPRQQGGLGPSTLGGSPAGSFARPSGGGLAPWAAEQPSRNSLFGPSAAERGSDLSVGPSLHSAPETHELIGPPASARPETIEAPPSPVMKPKTTAPARSAAPPPPAQTERKAAPVVPVRTPQRGLFGLAPAPFVEGDFVAAWRMPNGQWSVVQPAPEPFPNSWQRRVVIWFAVSFTLTAPFGWLFARRIVKPLSGFVEAAELLGRDPSAVVRGLDGPAEVGRAARAFNRMQSRLKSFVDDRTAMVGAISHDLRTPLTRLRFRIEDVESETMRDDMIGEVEEMEQMITSVLAFIRDASTPGVRERLDLRTILDEVVRNVTLIGGDAAVEAAQPAPVEVDILGIRRLVTNLVENAVKYGERARIRLRIDQDCAVAEVADDGPGVPEDELERVFEPFYRATNATGKQGNGLGLAVCRSIARAHGGDVRLLRSERGFVAQLRIPLYDAA
ncbi:MAG TPA: ATP-binding protein [Magnetospirillaceae bacterium]|nr:ATP-binding protein [Magnetospirillaceae bacterium]